jgi:hypothetical protein
MFFPFSREREARAGLALPVWFAPNPTHKFSQQIQSFASGQNAGQPTKMYSPNFVDNMVVAEV